MKVIFLDIDGVLNSIQQCIGWGQDAYNYVGLNKTGIRLLKKLVELTNSKIVISSTWRYDGKEMIEGALAAHGWEHIRLYKIIIDVTPDLAMWRGKEIQDWLGRHPKVTDYVILDDDSDMLPEQMDHFVNTDGMIGFTIYDMVKAAEILGIDAGKEKQFEDLKKQVDFKLNKRKEGNHGYTI